MRGPMAFAKSMLMFRNRQAPEAEASDVPAELCVTTCSSHWALMFSSQTWSVARG